MIEVVILAAGKGTRMRSDLPKVMHVLAGKPLLGHVIDCAQHLQPAAMHLVVGHGAEVIKNSFSSAALNYVLQEEQLGTGHAVQQVLPHLKPDSITLILYGDVPLIRTETLKSLLALADDNTLALLTAHLDNPAGYGRILRTAGGEIEAIVEQKDANGAQLQITEVNSGVMAVRSELLQSWLPTLRNDNAQGEYYLTDIVSLAKQQGYPVKATAAAYPYEIQGINNRMQQAQLERQWQQLQAEELMLAGTTLMDPARFDCRGSVHAGTDCVIDVNCVFEGDVTLGNGVIIGPNCVIKNSSIGDGSVIHANSVIEEAKLNQNCVIGPFARIRPGCEFAAEVKVGNFVEVKKASVGRGSKINHLSYVGDAELGADVNIGAGTITCNYDGANKFKTVIADEVFVGSNSALVAPVTIAAGATIAAGSTVTQNVEKQQLAVARARQRNIDDWHRPQKR